MINVGCILQSFRHQSNANLIILLVFLVTVKPNHLDQSDIILKSTSSSKFAEKTIVAIDIQKHTATIELQN